MVNNNPLKLLLLLGLLQGIFCSLPLSGGGGSEIPNGSIVVTVNDTAMIISVSKESNVYVMSSGYDVYRNKGYADSMLVTPGNEWRMSLPPTGLYNVVVIATDNLEGAFISTIPVQTGIAVTTPSTGYEVLCDLSGTTLYGTDGSALKSVTVFLTGTPFREVSDEEGRFRFNAVPPGTYTVRALAYLPCDIPDAACQAVSIEDTIETVLENGNDSELIFYLQ